MLEFSFCQHIRRGLNSPASTLVTKKLAVRPWRALEVLAHAIPAIAPLALRLFSTMRMPVIFNSFLRGGKGGAKKTGLSAVKTDGGPDNSTDKADTERKKETGSALPTSNYHLDRPPVIDCASFSRIHISHSSCKPSVRTADREFRTHHTPTSKLCSHLSKTQKTKKLQFQLGQMVRGTVVVRLHKENLLYAASRGLTWKENWNDLMQQYPYLR